MTSLEPQNLIPNFVLNLLSKHFAEVLLKMAYFDKGFRQRFWDTASGETLMYLFSAEGTAVGARRLRRFNARLPTGYGLFQRITVFHVEAG